jgi:4-amino-4-deoxy-L-arabinose transferase-like glycosyltransferase
LLTYATFALGVFGLFSRTAFLLLFAVTLAIGWQRLGGLIAVARALQQKWETGESLRSPLVSMCVVFIAAFAGMTAVVVVTPSITADALTFHLNLTRSYAASASLHTPAWIPYGWFPQAFEVLMTAPWLLGGQPAAQFVGVLFFPLALLVVAAIVRICGYSRAAAIVAVTIVVATPFIHWTGSVVKNDLMLAAWELAALYAVLRWRSTREFRWILLSAFFIALALQVKLVLLFGFVPIAVLWLIALWRQPRRVLAAAVLALVLIVFGSFSLLRTWLGTGNPFYPASASQAVERGTNASPGPWILRYMRIPWNVHFDGYRLFESSSPNPVGMATIVLLPCLFSSVGRKRSWAETACWVFVFAYLVYWVARAPALRYAVPAFAVLAGLLAARATTVFESAGAALRGILLAGFAWVLVFAWVTTVMIESYPAQLPYLARRIDASGFLRATLPPFGAMEFLVQNAAPHDTVLNLGAHAPVYGHDPARIRLINRLPERYVTSDLTDGLRDSDFQWVVLPNTGKGPELARVLSQLKRVRHVYGNAWFSVYRVEKAPK